MSNQDRYLYLYDLPKENTSSNKIAMIIKEKTGGHVLEVRPQIRRDLNKPFCTAIVSISDNDAFQKACKEMKYFQYEGCWCRALPFDNLLQGSNQQKLIDHNVFIAKIPKDDEHNAQWLDNYCSKFGDIKSIKISLGSDHTSRGYGFVCFQEPASATSCLEVQGGKSEICAVKYQPKNIRDFKRVFNNIYAKNLPDDFDEAKTRELFSKYGTIGMLKFGSNEYGKFAMIAYFSPDNKDDREAGPKAAAAAVEDLNNKEFNGGKKMYVHQFLKKSEREQEIRREAMKYKNSKKKCNLFVKNIPPNCGEKEIRDLFG
jgi:RNA recognition motif-containing protein